MGSPVTLPWNAFPRCPHLDIKQANLVAVLTLPSGQSIWHAVFGIPLEQSLQMGLAPVFFLHGGVSHSGYYGGQIEYFKTIRTVIVFDNRGHGRSPLGEQEITYDGLADDVLGILDHYSIPKAALVGWSDGAVMALSLLARHPERIDRVWAYGAVDDYRKTQVGDVPLIQVYFERTKDEWKVLNPIGNFENMFSKYLAMWGKDPLWTAETFKVVPIRGVDKDAPIVWIVTGDHDDWIPPETHQRLHSYLKNSSFLQMPSTGHLAFIQNPKLYNELVEKFLEDGPG
jgi:pimeloyl-ACP methyl ester carboxylesterase